MISEEPNVTNNGRYPVMETCRILGISKTTLRKYTEAGIIKCEVGTLRTSRKAATVFGRKVYTGAEIKKLWLLHM